MAKKNDALLRDLSTADLKRLLVARERIDVLEKEKAALETSLGKIEAELEKLVASAVAATGGKAAPGRTGTRKKAVRKKTATKKATRKKTATKKAVRKVAAKKATKKVTKTATKKTAKKATGRVAKKAAGKKTVKKAAARKAASGRKASGKTTLEDVIVGVLGRSGGKLSYKDLYQAIVGGKLFATKSRNFDNVMRRTLSTSDKVKRVARGVYALA